VADDAGALLVRSGLVSAVALEETRAKVADHGGTLGEQLVFAGLVDDDELTSFYRQRLLVPQVNPNTLARLPAKVVALIPSEMAIELRAIPLSLDNDNNLTVAMSDPSDRHAVDEIAFFTGTYVVRAVATQMQIAWCLAHYYGHITDLGERLLQPESEQAAGDSQPAPSPRTRGITGEVQAQRHRGLVPGEVFVPSVAPTAAPEAGTKPRSKTASGEIRVPRAPSIKPPLPDDSGPMVVVEDSDSGPIEPPPPSSPKRDSDPVIEMEADVGGPHEPVLAIGEGNESKPVPRRRRPAEPDPPELAARAGEVQLATGQPIKKIELHEPRIIVSDELAEELSPRASSTERAPIVRAIEVSGEVPVREHRDQAPSDDELSSIFVELGAVSAPVSIHDREVDESAPVLLEREREHESDALTRVAISAAPEREIEEAPSEPIQLPPKRVAEQRPKKTTQVGIGAISASARSRQASGGVPSEIEDAPTQARPALDADPTRIDAHAVAPADDDVSDELLAAPPSPYDHRDTTPHAVQPSPVHDTPPPSGQIPLDNVRPAPASDGDEDDAGNTTAVMSPIELDESIPGRTSQTLPAHLDNEQTGKKQRAPSRPGDDIDDGWGPPGTTIPPPLLGAIPGAVTPASGIIPLPDVDSAPLIVAPPLPPEPSRGARALAVTEQGLARALEEATARVLELIHTLDHTTDRDQIIAVMIAHLAESHRRAGFFAMRAGALSLFAITPRIAQMPTAQLRLDRPSTLQDVVGTRLPYRGPMLDDTSRGFLTATLGASPPEILLVPIAVRERVVGVLFGDQRVKHTFDDQLALAARAAGMALEALLRARRG
jgi:hypothetical protein